MPTNQAVENLGRETIRLLLIAAKIQDERDEAIELANRRGQITGELIGELSRRSQCG